MPAWCCITLVCHASYVYGSLRLHEIFPKKETEHNPSTTLLRRNVKLKTVCVEGSPVEVLLLDLKSPKESKGNSVRVELFANGKKSCPVRAYKKLLQFWGHVKEWNIPLMTKSEGSMFSGREFNKLLKRLTSNIKNQVVSIYFLTPYALESQHYWHAQTIRITRSRGKEDGDLQHF